MSSFQSEPPTLMITARPSGRSTGSADAAPRYRVVQEAVAVAVAPLAAMAIIFVPSPSVRFACLLLAILLVPGSAAIAPLELDTASQSLGLAAAVGVAISACSTVTLLWLNAFSPVLLAAALGVSAECMLVLSLRQRAPGRQLLRLLAPSRGDHAVPAAELALGSTPLVAGFGLWLLALSHTHGVGTGFSGLLGAVPASWYLALAVLLCGSVVALSLTPTPPTLTALYVAAVVCVLLGTAPAVSSTPLFDYVYKHIGIIGFLVAHGHVGPTVDIYNRWPTFFSLAAAMTRISGLSPLSYANWAMPAFTALNALMLAGLTQTVTGSRRAAGYAALLFTCANWIGQTYMSPQAFAFMLACGLLLMMFAKLGASSPSRLVTALGKPFAWRRRVVTDETFVASRGGQRLLATALVLLIDFVIVSAHQFTPYAVLADVGVCVVLGVAGDIPLLLMLAAITVGYLLPNLHFVQTHYGLFTSILLVSLFHVGTFGLPSHREALYADAGSLLTAFLLAVTTGCALLLLIRGRAHKVVPLLVLTAVPIVLLAGGDYGGEGPLRVFLFSAPWQCLLIALLLSELQPRRFVPLAALITVPVVGLCAISFLGNLGAATIPPGEIRAEAHLEADVPRRASVFLAGSSFPFAWTPDYPRLLAWSNGQGPLNLFDTAPQLTRAQTPATVLSTVVATITAYGGPPYLVIFARSSEVYYHIYRVVRRSVMAAVQQDIAASPAFTLWFQNSSTSVYRLR